MFNISDGDVTLINNNGEVAVIIINKYKSIVVGAFDEDTQVLYDPVNKGVSLNLDVDEVHIKSVRGTEADIATEKKGSILTYLQSLDGQVITGNVGGFSLISKVSAKLTGKDGYLTLGSAQYPYVAELEESIAAIELDKEYTFYINVNNRIVGMEALNDYTDGMAYMLRAFIDDGGESTKLKVLKPDALDQSDAVTLECGQNVKIDGARCRGEGIIGGLLMFDGTTNIPILYKLDKNGLVYEIDTPYYNREKESNDSLKHLYNGNRQGAVYSKTAEGWGYRNLFGGMYMMDHDGMCIQKIGESEIVVADYVKNDSRYKMDIFGVGDSPLVCFAVINDPLLSKPALEKKLAIVMKKYVALNSDGDAVTFLNLFIDNKEVEYEILASEDTILSGKVDRGDIIRFALDARSRITDISVALDYSEKESSIGYENYTFEQNVDFRLVIGKVYDVYQSTTSQAGANNNIIQFFKDTNDIENSKEVVFARSGRVFRYKLDRKDIQITELKAEEIKTYKTSQSSADMFVMASNYDTPSYIYIVSND